MRAGVQRGAEEQAEAAGVDPGQVVQGGEEFLQPGV